MSNRGELTRRCFITGSSVATAAVAAGFPGIVRAASNEPIRIGVICGLSGVNSPVAPAVVQSAQLAVSELNGKGGVLGRKLELSIVDDESGASGAVKAFNSAVYDKKVNIIIAMETSAARNAGEPIAGRTHMPFIYTSFYEGGACAPNLFVNAWVPPQVVVPLVKFMAQEKHVKTWYAVGSDYAFGRGMIDAAVKYIQATGGKVLGQEFNPLSSTDWEPILSKVRAAKPDGIIYATSGGSPNATFLKQYKATGLDLPVGSLSIDELTAQKIGEPAEGVYYTADYFTTLKNPENEKYLAAMKRMFGSKLLTPNDLSEPEYDGVYAYAMAIERAKDLDADAVMKALPEIAFKGPRGVVQMNKEHHAALPIYLAQIQRNGESKVIKSFGLISPSNQCPHLS
ncbi:MAG: substrate-binding protein [bacterium]|nr:substrate-binding protein [bacterium]